MSSVPALKKKKWGKLRKASERRSLVGHDGVYLQSQSSGGRGRGTTASLRPAGDTWQDPGSNKRKILY